MQNDRLKPPAEQDQYPIHLLPGMMSALIPREISRAARSGGDLSIVMLALNGLDLVRSRYGSTESEQFIVEAAHLLRPANDDGSASLQVFVNPLVSLIWLGGALFLLGTIIAAWPERTRLPAPAAAPLPREAVPIEA